MDLPKKICCIGAGYVGGPTMAMIALKCPMIEVGYTRRPPGVPPTPSQPLIHVCPPRAR
jgi:hypothetical protein